MRVKIIIEYEDGDVDRGEMLPEPAQYLLDLARNGSFSWAGKRWMIPEIIHSGHPGPHHFVQEFPLVELRNED